LNSSMMSPFFKPTVGPYQKYPSPLAGEGEGGGFLRAQCVIKRNNEKAIIAQAPC